LFRLFLSSYTNIQPHGADRCEKLLRFRLVERQKAPVIVRFTGIYTLVRAYINNRLFDAILQIIKQPYA